MLRAEVVVRFLLLGLGGWISPPLLDVVAVLVKSGDDLILLDCGEGTVKQLLRLGFQLQDLRTVIVTHSHGDHALGFPSLVIWLSHVKHRVKVFALETVCRDLTKLVEATRIAHHMVEVVELVELKSEYLREPARIFETESTEVYAVLTDHTVESIAVKIVEKHSGQTLVYTSDTRPCSSVVQLAKEADVLIHEASCSDPAAHLHGHSTVQDAVEIARQSKVKVLVPVHFYVRGDLLIRRLDNVCLLIPCPGIWYDVGDLTSRCGCVD